MEGSWAEDTETQPSRKRPCIPAPSDETEHMGQKLLSLFSYNNGLNHVFTGGLDQGVFNTDRDNEDDMNISIAALDLDLYYARLVCGAAVSTNMKVIWVPGSADSPEQEEMTTIRSIIWQVADYLSRCRLRPPLSPGCTNPLFNAGNRQANGSYS